MTLFDAVVRHAKATGKAYTLGDIIAKVEKRDALSVADKLRTWFTYATVVVPDMQNNPSRDLVVVALPLPPVNNNPFLRMLELPLMLQTLCRYPGRLNTQLGVRLLLLTGVRTGELRLVTPDQFDLERGLCEPECARSCYRVAGIQGPGKWKRQRDLPL